jgi:soluble lytic murein transglycosylase-like protein
MLKNQPLVRLFAGLAALAVAMPALASAADDAAVPGMVAVKENGKTVWVNTPEARPEVRRHSVLVYWSNAEKRWKQVPAPPPWVLASARTAAADVQSYVGSRPRGTSLSTDPNYTALSRGHRVSSQEIDDAIDKAAQKHNVDANLVRAIIKQESNFNPSAVSNKGAMGLMQLMPGTARQLGVSNPFDPQQNVDAGVRHFKQLLDNYNGDVRLGLAAYNAGEGAVARSNGVPRYRETQNYVKSITARAGMSNEPGTTVVGPSRTPVKMYRDKDGQIRITNTE